MLFASTVDAFANFLGVESFEVRALTAVLLVSYVCGLIGTSVVGNRMAFFSDAMAHCAFAGVALGILILLLSGAPQSRDDDAWLIPLVMATFGVAVGLAISIVRERSGLAADTVIGVFFAGAVGSGAMLLTALKTRRAIDPEQFLFGSPLYVRDSDLFYLTVLAIVISLLLLWRYNAMTLTGLHPGLARSRGWSVRINRSLLIIAAALVVNLSIAAVGVLLINAMLIVPAATAGLLGRGLRSSFWSGWTLSMTAGLGGLLLSGWVVVRLPSGERIQFGPSGVIICLSVVGFFVVLMSRSVFRRA